MSDAKSDTLLKYWEIIINLRLFSEVALEELALLAFQAPYGLFLDLAYAFTCKIEFRTDFLERHLLTANAEKHLYDLALAVVELAQGTVYLL